MKQFASKTPRDLNHDPAPVRIAGKTARSKRVLWDGDVFDPRPEFDHVQHNPESTVLSSFRKVGDAGYPDAWIAASFAATEFGGYPEWDDPRSYFHVFTTASRDEILHAREVLARLQSIKQGVFA